jgi:hypothetical protein
VFINRAITETLSSPVRTVEVSIDNQHLGSSKGHGMFGEPLGIIPYVPGNHQMLVTAVCKSKDRGSYRIDHRVRLLLHKMRPPSAKLKITIGINGDLEQVKIFPEDAGDIAIG